ncbi:MAG: ABC transporter substrate-binding protein [Roseburia sp.]
MKKRLILSVIIGTIALGVFSGCGSEDEKATTNEKEVAEESTENEKLVIHIAGNTQAIAADSQGYFEEELEGLNAEVELVNFASGPSVASAEATGDIDFGQMGDQPAIAAVAAGYEVTAVSLQSVSTEYNQLYALADSGIDSLEDLKGKRIGVEIGSVKEFQFLKALELANISKDEVEIVNSSDTVALLNGGEIDAAMSNIGTVQELIDDGTVKVIADGDDTGIISTIWIVARNGFIEEHPEETLAVLRAYERADRYIAENEEEFAKIYSEYTQVDESLALATVRAQNEIIEITDEAIEAASQVLDFMVENDLIDDTGLTFDEVYTDEYWKKALEE